MKRLEVGPRLTAIVGASACGFVLIVVVGWLIDRRVHHELVTIQQTYVPKVELGPRLAAQYAKVQRAFQDAVAANDIETINEARVARDELIASIDASKDVLGREDASTLRWAVEQYYAIADDVAKRIMANETGDAILQTVAEMHEREHRVGELITGYTAIDRTVIDATFARVVASQVDAGRFRVVVSLVFLLVVGGVSLVWARLLLRLFENLLRQLAQRQLALDIADKEIEALALLAHRIAIGARPEHLDLSAMAREVARELSGEPSLVTVTDDLSAEADACLGRAVLTTLIGNALRRTAALPAPRIEVGTTMTDGVKRFYIRDNSTEHDIVSAKTIRVRFEDVWCDSASTAEGTTFFFTFLGEKNRVNS